MKINKFKYVKDKWNSLKAMSKFEEVADFLTTSLAFGLCLFLLNVRNSFAKGIGFAIMFALVQGYIKWFAEIVKDIKRSK